MRSWFPGATKFITISKARLADASNTSQRGIWNWKRATVLARQAIFVAGDSNSTFATDTATRVHCPTFHGASYPAGKSTRVDASGHRRLIRR
jgi:hypothetical protein